MVGVGWPLYLVRKRRYSWAELADVHGLVKWEEEENTDGVVAYDAPRRLSFGLWSRLGSHQTNKQTRRHAEEKD